jgi:hypothetical protein
MAKTKDSLQEYYIYNADGELEDVVTFSKQAVATYKKKFPDYLIEPVDCDYTEYDD